MTAIGNAKGHESPFLLALQIVWHRYHNKVASDIKQTTHSLSDEQVFNLARKRVIATFQVSICLLGRYQIQGTTHEIPTLEKLERKYCC